MLLGKEEEKVYYSYVGEQSQGPVGEYRVDMTRLSWAIQEEEKGKKEGREGSQVQQPGGTKIQKWLDYIGMNNPAP